MTTTIFGTSKIRSDASNSKPVISAVTFKIVGLSIFFEFVGGEDYGDLGEWGFKKKMWISIFEEI